MVAKKQPKYEPIGDFLSTESAWVQAAHALDLAGEFAVESRDIPQLTQVAAMYIELGSRMAAPEEEDEEEEEHDLTSQPAGFVLPEPKEEPVKEIEVKKNGRTYRNTKAEQAQG